MLEEPQILQTPETTAAVIHIRAPRADLPTLIPEAVEELLATIARDGLAAQGPMFAHYLEMPGDEYDFEVGFPVGGPVEPGGCVKPGSLPAATIARTVYQGPYEGLHDAWGRFQRELQESGKLDEAGLTPGGTLWETYLTGPATEEDAGKYRTELNLVLVGE